MITAIPAPTRLQLLKEYMAYWVSKWPDCKLSFESFLYHRRPQFVPGTKEHAREIATHCFYCDIPFGGGMQEPTIDHFLPLSVHKHGGKYVICCYKCNQAKANIHPDQLLKKVARATLRNLSLWGHSGKKVYHISEQVQKVHTDMLYNMGPSIYYIKKT